MCAVRVGSRLMIDISHQFSSHLYSTFQHATRTLQHHSNPMQRNRLLRDGCCIDQIQRLSLGFQLPQPQCNLSRKQPEHRRFLSTSTASSGTSFFSSPLQWWRNRQEVQELDKYKLRIVHMADKEAWFIGDAIKEIDDSLNTWKAKVPGASTISEIKLAKAMRTSMQGIAKVVGNEATEEMIVKMSHKDKLLAAVNGETTLESINTLIEQFRTMSLMHRALRKRRLENKPLPTTPEAVSALLKVEAPRLMSKEQKSKLGKEQAKQMLKRHR